jgi:hypothetical protein
MSKPTIKASELFEITSVKFERGCRKWSLKVEPIAVLDVEGFDFARVVVSPDVGQAAADSLKRGVKSYMRLEVVEVGS